MLKEGFRGSDEALFVCRLGRFEAEEKLLSACSDHELGLCQAGIVGFFLGSCRSCRVGYLLALPGSSASPASFSWGCLFHLRNLAARPIAMDSREPGNGVSFYFSRAKIASLRGQNLPGISFGGGVSPQYLTIS